MTATAHSARPTHRPTIAATVVALAVLAAACVGTTPTGQTIRGEAPRREPNDEFLPSTVNAANGFAIDLYRASAGGQGNFVASSYSVMLALGMSRAGSAGATRDQFDTVLHARETVNLDEGLNTVEQLLASRAGEQSSTTRKGRVTMNLDASVWGQRGTRFKADYLDILSADYDTPMRVVDFRSDPDTARDAINRWASDSTQGRITEVVPRGDITEVTRFLPVAVSYLRAPWQVPFDQDLTRTGSFVRLDGETVDVRSMQVSSTSEIRSGKGPDWTAVEIPYLGNQLSLLIVVPATGTFESFQGSLDVARLDTIVEGLDSTPVDLRLPTFQFTTSGDLTDELESLGLTDAFTRSADFSGITSDELLNLAGVASQGYFGIDEEGTDADTTANAAEPEPPVPGSPRLTVDRPFVFAVRDRETGLVLVIGQVVSPN
jgi:serine protease inhibitor